MYIIIIIILKIDLAMYEGSIPSLGVIKYYSWCKVGRLPSGPT